MSLRKPGKGTRQPHGRGVPHALAMARKWTQIGQPGARMCVAIRANGNPCTALALKGVSRCQYHGGFGSLALVEASRARRANVGSRIAAWPIQEV